MNDRPAAKSSSTRALPTRPNLERLKNEAKSRLKELRRTEPSTQLAAAQKEIARGYGFPSWRKLRAFVEHLSFARTLEEMNEEKIARLRVEQAAKREEINTNPETLVRFTGYYELSSENVFAIMRDGDALIARLGTQPFFEVVPESDRKFFYKNSSIKAQLTFIVNGEGSASALILHQHGLEQTAKRISESAAKRIEARFNERRSTNLPALGSEAAVYRMIKEIGAESPCCDFMSEGLAKAFGEQLSDNRRQLRSWGALVSVSFVGVSKGDGCDVYDVRFSQTRTEWRVRMGSPDHVHSAGFRHYP